MAWQDMFAGSATRIDAEHEQELRLAAQARQGADWALGALIARYQPTVVRYLTRLTGNPPRTRLLSEQIFLRMERRLHGPHGGQHLRLWLLRACTEAGLDELRKPHHLVQRVQLDQPQASALLSGQASSRTNGQAVDTSASPTDRLRAGLGTLADKTSGTGRQLRQLFTTAWSDPIVSQPAAVTSQTMDAAASRSTRSASQQARSSARMAQTTQAAQAAPKNGKTSKSAKTNGSTHKQQRQQAAMTDQQRASVWDAAEPPIDEDESEWLHPRDILRYRMIRAVLAELPYGDAQCLALHLIAGLNQAEVARALGITHSATRRRIVQGLQLFSQRYDAAVASLGFALDDPSVADEATVTLESPEDPRESSYPSQRAPVVVSARLTNPLTFDVAEESTVIWDLPPFPEMPEGPSGLAEAAETLEALDASKKAATEPEHPQTQPAQTTQATPLEVSEEVVETAAQQVQWLDWLDESDTPNTTTSGAPDEATRRVIWSRPPTTFEQPAPYSGEEVTIRVPRPTVEQEHLHGAADMSQGFASSGAITQPLGDLVEPETLHEPPPAALVVDADVLPVASMSPRTEASGEPHQAAAPLVPTLTSDAPLNQVEVVDDIDGADSATMQNQAQNSNTANTRMISILTPVETSATPLS